MIENNKHTAYLLGVYMSDGNINILKRNRRSYEETQYMFRLAVIDDDFIQKTKKEINKILPHKVWVQTDKHMKLLICSSKELVMFLKNQTEHKTKVPEWLFKTNKENKRAFIAGFLDGDGWVQKSPKGQIQVGMVSTSEWVDDIAKILQSIGVKIGKRQILEPSVTKLVTGKKKRIRYILQTQSFIDSGCYFSIKRKQDRFRDYNAVSEKRKQREILFGKYKKYRKSNNKESYRELENRFNISRETARLWDKKIRLNEPLYRMKG